jgi:hypothetical protein
LRRDEKNHDRQPIRKKPHAAAKPVWMLSLIGGIGSPLQGLSVATSLIASRVRIHLCCLVLCRRHNLLEI